MPRIWLGIPLTKTALALSWALTPALLTGAGLLVVSTRFPLPPLAQVLVFGTSGTLFFAATAWLLHRRRLGEAVREITSKLR